MTTIDLGVLPPAGGDDAPLDSGSAGGWSRRPIGWVAAMLSVLVMLTAGASAAPRQPWAVLIFTVPLGAQVASGGVTLTEDTLYMEGRTTGDQGTLTAYRLTDGTQRWEQTADHAHAWSGKPALWHATSAESGSTTLLDPETGQPRWRGPGDLRAVVGDRLLVVTTEALPPEQNVMRWQSRLTALDRQTTHEVWSLPAVDSWNHVAPGPGRPGRLVTVDGSRLSTYDLTTGTMLTSVDVPGLEGGWASHVVGNVVLVEQAEPAAMLRAFDLDALRPLWTREFRSQAWSVAQCGELVCANDRRLIAIDPATGEQVWSGPRLNEYASSDAMWVPGYILISTFVATYPYEDFQVVDAATGEVVMELDGWLPLFHQRYQPPDGGSVGVVTRYQPSREVVVEQMGPNRRQLRFQEIGQTWFARLDPGQGRLEVLGAVASGPTGCQATVGHTTAGPATNDHHVSVGYIACEYEGSVQVWRVR